MSAWLTVVGIGEDGFDGLGREAQTAITNARTIFGGERHISLLPRELGADLHPWPKPFGEGLKALLALRGEPVCVLASGDPMLFGIGATLARDVPVEEMRVLPAPSAFSLAAARLGWALQDTAQLSVHGRPAELVHPHLHHGRQLLILAHDGGSPTAIAALLRKRGFGDSRIAVLEHLGGPLERRIDATAASWQDEEAAPLNVIAVHCQATPQARHISRLAGLPDDAFQHDGQLTKRAVRAATLAHLAPCPGEVLWDVGAGCGSISIEWMRSDAACRAVAVEENAGRQQIIRKNAADFGVPGLQVVAGSAPAALAGLPQPDAVFIGGAVTESGVIETCWNALRPGGRLVANAVTVQSETVLVAWRARVGGDLVRIAISNAEPLGGFDVWRAALPVTLFAARKPL